MFVKPLLGNKLKAPPHRLQPDFKLTSILKIVCFFVCFKFLKFLKILPKSNFFSEKFENVQFFWGGLKHGYELYTICARNLIIVIKV